MNKRNQKKFAWWGGSKHLPTRDPVLNHIRRKAELILLIPFSSNPHILRVLSTMSFQLPNFPIMQFDSPELRELRYISWSPPAHPLFNFLGTPEPKEHQHHSYSDIPRPLSPTTSNSHSTHFNRAVGSPLTSGYSSPATSESTSIPRLYRILDRVARDRYYSRPRHVMIDSEEGVPIKLIGRLPEKVGYERTMWTIKSASYYELCDIGQRLEDARHPTYGILVEEIKLLKARLFLETGRGNNNSPGLFVSVKPTQLFRRHNSTPPEG